MVQGKGGSHGVTYEKKNTRSNHKTCQHSRKREKKSQSGKKGERNRIDGHPVFLKKKKLCSTKGREDKRSGDKREGPAFQDHIGVGKYPPCVQKGGEGGRREKCEGKKEPALKRGKKISELSLTEREGGGG